MTIPEERWNQILTDLRTIEDQDRFLAAQEDLDRMATRADLVRLEALLRDEDMCVREAAATPYARLSGIEGLQPLLEALRRGEREGCDNDYLVGVTWGLLDSDPDRAAETARRYLGSPDGYRRGIGAWLAGHLGGRIRVLELLPFADDCDADVRAAVAGALGSSPENSDALPTLLRLLGDQDETVRSSAAGALGYLRSPAAVPHLIQALVGDPDPGVRAIVVYSLGSLADPRARPALLAASNDSDQSVAEQARRALSLLPHEYHA